MSKPGIKVTKLEKLGLRMDSCCEITFDDVELDEKDMFGRKVTALTASKKSSTMNVSGSPDQLRYGDVRL